jgi:hypothetical protein
VTRGILPVLAGAGAGAAVVFSLATGVSHPEQRLPSRPAPAAAAAASEAPIRREEIQALQMQLELLTRTVGTLAAEGAALRAVSAPPEAVAEPRPTAEPKPEAGAAELERLSALEARLQDEAEDGPLSASLEEELSERLADGRARGAALRATVCGTTLCRLEFALDEPAPGNPALLDLTQLVPWDGEGILHVPGDEPRTAILFVAREGAAL